MIARGTDAEVSVIALVGERGREVREFLEDDLGPEGLARSVVVVATSDEPPLVRLRAAFVATRIAESFRDRGPRRRADDGLAHPRGDGPARDRALRRRAAGDARLPAVDLLPARPAARARRDRTAQRLGHRHLHRARRRRRPQRADRRRRALDPRRARRADAGARRRRALPEHRRARLGLARRLARHHARAARPRRPAAPGARRAPPRAGPARRRRLRRREQPARRRRRRALRTRSTPSCARPMDEVAPRRRVLGAPEPARRRDGRCRHEPRLPAAPGCCGCAGSRRSRRRPRSPVPTPTRRGPPSATARPGTSWPGRSSPRTPTRTSGGRPSPTARRWPRSSTEAAVAAQVVARRGEIAAAEWTAARTTVATLDKLAERHEVLVRAEDERVEQLVLDEAASRRHQEDR